MLLCLTKAIWRRSDRREGFQVRDVTDIRAKLESSFQLTILMPQIDDSIMYVLRHGLACTQPRPLLTDHRPSARIRIFQKPSITNARKQPVVREEF